MRNARTTKRNLNTRLLTVRRRRRLLTRSSLVLACIVLFWTTYGMILPAITAEKADMTGTSLMAEEAISQDFAAEEGIEVSTETEEAEDSEQENADTETAAAPEAGTLVEILEEGSEEARIGIILETETN